MKRISLLVLATMFAVPASFAGGLLTNTNQSVHFLRNPARNASMEIDAAYTNPAGLTFLSDGFHFSLTNQSAFQTRTINSTFTGFAFAEGNNGSAAKQFKGEASVPIIPSFQLAYKRDKVVFSTSFGITGGGGKAIFNEGLASFESSISMLPIMLSQKGIETSAYSVDSYMEGRQYIFGWQLNGSYQLSEHFSVGVGLRLNVVNNKYVGHLRNISINPTHPALNPTGSMMKATDFFNGAYTAATSTANTMAGIESQGYGAATLGQLVNAGMMTQAQVDQLAQGLGVTSATAGAMDVSSVKQGYVTVAATNKAYEESVGDKNLDCTQTGWGVTPILSLNYHTGGLNLAARYEFVTSLNVQNKTKVDDTGLYTDGVNTPHDIPALLSLGAEYAITKHWKIAAGYHHYFDSDAEMANDKQQYIDGGINEFLFGTEYQLTEQLLLSFGGQITRSGVTDDYQTDMSFSLNSYSLGFGGAYNISPALRLNLAYFFTDYDDWTKTSTNYNGTGLPGTDVFARTNKVFGIGIDYKF
ncbi:OmpP1/FadL family transporter [Mangrovibacterium marinum]|nr:aromatic hydrocarbon degradation protein [Mangrovibacterium marinum]